MDYIESYLQLLPENDWVKDLLATRLGEIGYESFVETQDGMLAYIPVQAFDAEDFRECLSNEQPDYVINVSHKTIPGQNWNEEWEKNYFQPIVIGRECVIHSSFHTDVPSAVYDVLIDPKMAFGTGHHETTSLMLGELLTLDIQNKSFLDMGCGTAVLAILASMKGAYPVLGVDIDEWAVRNALENCCLNNTPNVAIRHGGVEWLAETESFDVVFANINRNILLRDMANYVAHIQREGLLFMSGFYESDVPVIRKKAESLDLTYEGFVSKNNWVAVRFRKPYK